MTLPRDALAGHIAIRLAGQEKAAQRQFQQSGLIPSFTVDDLLPSDIAHAIYQAFPPTGGLVLKRTLGQLKYVGYQMSSYEPLLEEIIYAFQDPRVVRLISSITGLQGLLPEERLYAGGVSVMVQGHYLNPHLDNSHDLERNHYRVLNLLYYVTPDWGDSTVATSSYGIRDRGNKRAPCTAGSTGWWRCRPTRVPGTRSVR